MKEKISHLIYDFAYMQNEKSECVYCFRKVGGMTSLNTTVMKIYE